MCAGLGQRRAESRARQAAAGRGRMVKPGAALDLKSRLPEYQHLQASGPPGLLLFAHMAADRSAHLRQEVNRARRAAGHGRSQQIGVRKLSERL